MDIAMMPAFVPRAKKQTKALKKVGYNVIGLSAKTIDERDLYADFQLYCTQFSLAGALSAMDESINIVHVHHEPAWMLPIAKQMGYKTVLDVGDLELVRTGRVVATEIKALEEADALIFSSDRFSKFIKELGITVSEKQEVIYSFSNEDEYQMPTFSDGGIAYGGTILPPWIVKRKQYRNLFPVIQRILSMGKKSYIYPSTSKYAEFYSTLDKEKVIVNETSPYTQYISNLGKHHWGFVGSSFKHNRFMDNIVSHKMFDYVAAGIPVIVHNAEKSAELIKEYDIGIVVDNLEEVNERYDEWKDYSKKVLAIREKLTLESQVGKLINTYTALV